nr:unnamed protein product [Callosobruchus chinensis]CAH7756977.1 unnamed protein product [Callosobruchus chinensis]
MQFREGQFESSVTRP